MNLLEYWGGGGGGSPGRNIERRFSPPPESSYSLGLSNAELVLGFRVFLHSTVFRV